MSSGPITVGRITLNHTYGGRGEPGIILIHGLGSAGYVEWRHNLPALARSWAVYAPDLPGFGRSQKPRVRYDVGFFVRTLERYMDAVGRRSAVVVGASLGGRIAAELAIRHPRRVRSLVLVDSLGLGQPNLQIYYPLVMLPGLGESLMRGLRTVLGSLPNRLLRGAAERFTPGQSGAAYDDSYLDDLREMHRDDSFHEAYLSTLRSLARPRALASGADLVGSLAATRVPVQLIWGLLDPVFPVAHALEAHRRLPGSRLAVIEDAGHTPQAERPDEFNRIVEEFVKS